VRRPIGDLGSGPPGGRRRKPGTAIQTLSPDPRGTGKRSPCDPSRGGTWPPHTAGPPRLGLRRSSIPRKPGDERKKPNRGTPANRTDRHTNAVSRPAGDRRAVALRPEPKGAAWRTGPEGPLDSACGARRSPGNRGMSVRNRTEGHPPTARTAIHAVSRSAGDRRAVALRPEPRGPLGRPDRRAPSTRPPALVDPPETGGLRRSLRTVGPPHTRCLPLRGGPASGRPATRAEGAAWQTGPPRGRRRKPGQPRRVVMNPATDR
jgi:hypothetical protein